ncbi:MAG TPA: nucleotidyltransferase domain-containing protein [Azonexus sp.]|nr:nucleotidyltransferase domain-containing protein [Azonexus sp.]
MSGTDTTNHSLSADALEKICQILATNPCIEKGILYGSLAKGNFRAGFDIELCLVAPTLSLTEKFAIETQLEDLLLPWKVDLSLAHLIDNPSLVEDIERVGVDLYRLATKQLKKPAGNNFEPLANTSRTSCPLTPSGPLRSNIIAAAMCRLDFLPGKIANLHQFMQLHY